MRGFAVTLPILFFAASWMDLQADGIDLQKGLEVISSSTMKVNFTARVLPYNQKPIWNVEGSRITLPGRSIRIRLDGDNLRVYLICTPYIQADGNILLLAQGQVWLAEEPDSEVKYSSTFTSMPLSWGEKVLFFPLGVSQDDIARKVTKEDLEKKVFNLEMEIQIVPNKDR